MGDLCLFLFLLFSLLLLPSKSPGLGYMAAHLQQKNPFYFKKNPHTHVTYSVCLVRRSTTIISCIVTRHIYPAASLRRKTGVSDQLHLRKVPSVHSTCCKIFVRSLFREILIMPLLNFHDWLHFWKHLRHFC